MDDCCPRAPINSRRLRRKRGDSRWPGDGDYGEGESSAESEGPTAWAGWLADWQVDGWAGWLAGDHPPHPTCQLPRFRSFRSSS
ncbi:unnamed protein product [Soboliphyme baturini]|uniref:Uncharacterized protein n=1 Tax=Soboliphyme baturini TaxID=241478 RepID=A0A183IGE6_9BILA|nr:unnamed protein product [Soboliphyme baturini]